MWKNSQELLSSIKTSLDRLRAGKITIDEAKADARLFTAASRIMTIQLEHAKATGRLTNKSAVLPAFMIGEDAKEQAGLVAAAEEMAEEEKRRAAA